MQKMMHAVQELARIAENPDRLQSSGQITTQARSWRGLRAN